MQALPPIDTRHSELLQLLLSVAHMHSTPIKEFRDPIVWAIPMLPFSPHSHLNRDDAFQEPTR